ncbi:curli-like amyloid fiber formation chaperone CsgH [Brevundimonas sp. NPDC092305]|uniref:curli-like amyloid fiber formation chaperone CsgH n=1 Tax=Brevundimonas sp. NPDC092305 TaxID=3363957 RepID=UPI00381E6C7B
MPVVWIEPTWSDGVVDLAAWAKSEFDLSGDFSLEVTRKSAAGSARTRQGGRVTLTAGEARRLSVVAIGPVATDQDWTAHLSLSSDGRVIAEADAPAA